MREDRPTSSKDVTRSPGSAPFEPPTLSLPQGGGALRGLGEKLATNPVTGSGSLAVPIATPPGRSGFAPALALTYDSGAGNGPFGLGWSLAFPAISRKTDKGLPRYLDAEDSDVFLLSDAEDLVPTLVEDDGEWLPDEKTVGDPGDPAVTWTVRRYRPRIEGAFLRIERWQHQISGEVHWRSVSRDNVTTFYGTSDESRLHDPADPSRVFRWLIAESFDAVGNLIRYEYKKEDAAGVDPALPRERNRLAGPSFANRYLKRILYGNAEPHQPGGWLFEVVFDYGEHEEDLPTPGGAQPWPCRQDPFSSYRSGFEIRTYRLCRRVLSFHRFAELGPEPYLVRSTDFDYSHGPDLTFLSAITQKGYLRQNDGTWTSQATPPLELGYTGRSLHTEVRTVDPESLENLPIGAEGSGYRWVDLDGEGISGVLSEQTGAWYYKRNLGEARLAPLELVATRPSPQTLQRSGRQLLDLDADGRLQVAAFGDPLPGFWERTADGGWTSFTSFPSVPNADWNDPSLRFVDLTGDGRADLLVSEDDVFLWYPSLGREGFAAPEVVRLLEGDEERRPRLLLADARQTLHLADMSGDGMPDLVRIRNGEVCYWPNLGHGRFGAKVTMDASPWLDAPDLFDPSRIRLADLDGSGPADLLYLGGTGCTIWFNQAGNGWSAAHALEGLPPADRSASVQVADLLGQGTACLVWSSPLPGDARQSLRYVDLLGGTKPHLLASIVNNLGAETRLQYASSTRFYLEDRAAGRPWITRLPFPVHVVEQVETRDHVTGTKLVTRHRYRHGYFDSAEREFRGFGMAEQWDTETFPSFAGKGLFDAPPANADPEFHQPPVHTRTWFHTGAWLDGDRLLAGFAADFYQGDEDAPHLPPSVLPAGLTAAEEREACRALKGRVLRSEVYALDGTPASAHPYSVAERSYEVRRVQPRQGRVNGVFLAWERESLSIAYERNPEDPRLGHSLVLDVDGFGNVTRSVSIAYPRREPEFPEQEKIWITCTESRFTNKNQEDGWYRIGVPVETVTSEVTGLPDSWTAPYSLDEVRTKLIGAGTIPYEATPDPLLVQKRWIECLRTLYLKNDLSGPLPLGGVESLALPYKTYTLAFTPGLLSEVYGSLVDDDLLRDEGRYVKGQDLNALGLFEDPPDVAGFWWAPSGQPVFDLTRSKFHLPVEFHDPFGQVTQVEYDAHELVGLRTIDPLDNVAEIVPHYRTLGAHRLIDANGNRSGVRYDAFGRVIATAVMGKPGAGEGDVLDATTLEASPADDPTARIEYHFFAWRNQGQPVFFRSFARERHGASNPRWQEAWSYFDGFGRELMKKVQAEPGLAPARNPDGSLKKDANGELVLEPAASRWVGTGRTVLDNKGNPVKQYEPFFSTTSAYESEADLVAWGVTPILRYDPLARLIRTDLPDGTFSRSEHGPWSQTTWDPNDTVLDSRWFTDRDSLPITDPEGWAAQRAAAHAATPAVTHLDSLGRGFLSIADNGGGQLIETRSTFDIEGNLLAVEDARGNIPLVNAFDVLARNLRTVGMDAGERRILADVSGKTLRTWDGRGHTVRTVYDELRRATHLFVKKDGGSEILAERSVYGEAYAADDPAGATAKNLRGRLYQIYDASGAATHEPYDFKGNLLTSSRRLAVAYEQATDWSPLAGLASAGAIAAAASPFLETEVFTAHTSFDALNRPISTTGPDASEVRPAYNEANFLEKLDVRLRGSAVWTSFVVNVDYDAKGQRRKIEYGNGSVTEYTYDPLTFRLSRLATARPAGPSQLQDLSYTYDPAGNIVEVRDDAQPTVFFDNAVVSPRAHYVYDAVYRLIEASGREHGGLGAGEQPDEDDYPAMPLPHPNDPQALRLYSEQYEYDAVGNLLKIIHHATGGNWTRTYVPAAQNDRLLAVRRPGDPPAGPFTGSFTYDAHGNMTSMPHLGAVEWDFKDRLQSVDLGGGGEVFYVYAAGGGRIRKVWKKSPGLIEERIYLAGWELYRRHLNGAVETERETLSVMDDQRRIALVETTTREAGSAVASPSPLIRYQLENHLGSATLEVDASAAVLTYEEYHPYGTTAYRSAASGAEVSLKRYRYNGKEKDEETGLYYYGARYYACWLGRWASCDPAGMVDGTNLYRYTRNNPVRFRDPAGKQSKPEPPQGVVLPLGRMTLKFPSGEFPTFEHYLREALRTTGLSPVGFRQLPGYNEVWPALQHPEQPMPQLKLPHAGLPSGVMVQTALEGAEVAKGGAKVTAIHIVTTQVEVLGDFHTSAELRSLIANLGSGNNTEVDIYINEEGKVSKIPKGTSRVEGAVLPERIAKYLPPEFSARQPPEAPPSPPAPAPAPQAPAPAAPAKAAPSAASKPAAPAAAKPAAPAAAKPAAPQASTPTAPEVPKPSAATLETATQEASTLSKIGTGIVEYGGKALKIAGKVATVYGAATVAADVHGHVNEGAGLNKALNATVALGLGVVAGVFDDALIATGFGAPVVFQSWEQKGAGPAQVLVGEALKGLDDLWFK